MDSESSPEPEMVPVKYLIRCEKPGFSILAASVYLRLVSHLVLGKLPRMSILIIIHALVAQSGRVNFIENP